jgi:large subunit ribosomal protein L10
MSKKVKNLIERDLGKKLEGVEALAVLNPRGIDAIKNNQIRRKLREKGARMLVVKNTLVRRAVGGGKLKGFEQLLDGPCAVVFGDTSISSIARLLLEEKKTYDKMELRGVFFDGDIFVGEKGVEDVSKLPTREEAIANIAGLALAPARKLAGIFKGQGGKIASILKTIEDKAKEKEGAAAPAA